MPESPGVALRNGDVESITYVGCSELAMPVERLTGTQSAGLLPPDCFPRGQKPRFVKFRRRSLAPRFTDFYPAHVGTLERPRRNIICFQRSPSRIMALLMPGFGDTTFIVLLALLLFGPKKLPVLARQLGKLMADFRRASNEFRTQMEEELRISEQADRQKQIAAIEAAAPKAAEVIPEPEHPHLPPPPMDDSFAAAEPTLAAPQDPTLSHGEPTSASEQFPAETLPIASSGNLNLMPPSTGLPVSNTIHNPSVEPAPVLPDPATEAHAATNGMHHEPATEPEPAEARPWMI
ncbi:MAG: hypothetical protein NVSMB62_01830 [Acidobacteriaceae bacterium]